LILVDTSIWIDHLHLAVPSLVDALEIEVVLTHPFVIGELACCRLARRNEVLDLLFALPSSVVATDAEAFELIERQQLAGRGIGYIDVHLLASVLLTHQATLWTRDGRLAAVARSLGVAFRRP
jgi:predicted nucleic acid-binding protein